MLLVLNISNIYCSGFLWVESFQDRIFWLNSKHHVPSCFHWTWEYDYISEKKDNTVQLTKLRVLQKALKIAVHRGCGNVTFSLLWTERLFSNPSQPPASQQGHSQGDNISAAKHCLASEGGDISKRALMAKGKYLLLAACREKALSLFKSIRQIRKSARNIIFLGNRMLEKGCNILKHIYYTWAELCHL